MRQSKLPLHTRLEEVLDQDSDEDWVTACRVFNYALCSLILKEEVYGLFPLKHPDFHYNNNILLDDFNILWLTRCRNLLAVVIVGMILVRDIDEDSSSWHFPLRGVVVSVKVREYPGCQMQASHTGSGKMRELRIIGFFVREQVLTRGSELRQHYRFSTHC